MNENNDVMVILDNGHGVQTKGKRSPDQRLMEYSYTREIVKRIHSCLDELGIQNHILVPEKDDISLKERVIRANNIHKDHKKSILISVHCNAYGVGDKWYNAKGWSVYVAQNASKNSKRLAECLANQAEEHDLKTRYYKPGQSYWVQSLAMCRDTNCPAVLTENLFQDNKEDVDFLLSEEGKDTITQVHVKGIIDYING